MPNRLAAERSPYLLQHAGNPVDWYPWGEEAFERARAGDKPIFLSIGYSTCHWCHVMEHESFENDAIADVLNREFVAIKVDREERPDIDRVYMSFVQATTGSGGWPMSVWLTPDLKPFYGGTYFPPAGKWGRPGFIDMLVEIARLWKADRAKVTGSADELLARLRSMQDAAPRLPGSDEASTVAGPDSLSAGVAQFRQMFDARRGGFGSAPKFPRPSELLFLLREHARTGDERAGEMALQTLRAMALGGMRDHVGGGFHRYSVDAEWRVPHFEKMLYDQAQLTLAYLEAAQATGDAFYATIAEDTLAYVERDLLDPDGGFYSAEDADSVPPEQAADPHPHKSEGAFYIWSDAEIGALLGADADVVRQRFGILADGNAPQDPHGEFTGRNLLYVARSIEDVARLTGRTADTAIDVIGRARQTLYDARAARPRPHLDDKILSAWNGLMIAAFARAARGWPLEDAEEEGHRRDHHVRTARRAAAFLQDRMWDATRQVLLRRHRAGDSAVDGFSEDYASVIWGLLELFQSDPDPRWLDWAMTLQRRQNELFWDDADGGWFSTTGTDPSVLLRLKEDYDGAEPSASAVSVMNLLVLGHLTGDEDAARRVEKTFIRFGEGLGRVARAVPLMAAALSAYHAGIQQIVVVGSSEGADTRSLLTEIAQHYLPFAVLVQVEPGVHQAAVGERLPFVRDMQMRDGRATAYVCRDFTCLAPVVDPEALRAVLHAAPSADA